MFGNVWEWVEDCVNTTYDGAPTDGRTWGTGDCSRCVFRGGSWNDLPAFVRSADRDRFEPTRRISDLGGLWRLPEANVRRFRNRLTGLRARWRMGNVEREQVMQRVQSWIAHASHAHT